MNTPFLLKLLNGYPKSRIPLPDEIQAIYALHYHKNRGGQTVATSIGQKMERWLHKKVATDVIFSPNLKNQAEITTLEIGAGSLNQLPYEPVVGPYDIIEPFSELFQNNADLARIRSIFEDINDLPRENKYDRITSIAALEHIINLPYLIAKCCSHMNHGGAFLAAIPNEGTFLWTLGWKLTTAIEFRLKYGQDYGLLMAHEHVNTAKEIREILQYFFTSVKIKSFGLNQKIAFYLFFDCRGPNLERANNFLKLYEDKKLVVTK